MATTTTTRCRSWTSRTPRTRPRSGECPWTWATSFFPDDRALVARDSPRHVELWDVGDPAQPRRRAEHTITDFSGYDMGVVQDGTLYVPGHGTIDDTPAGGLLMVPLSGGPPRFWPIPGAGRDAMTRVAAFGRQIVAGDEDRYLVLDVSSVTPAVVATGRFQHLEDWLTDLAVVDGHLVAADHQRVEVHRLTGPGAPAFLKRFRARDNRAQPVRQRAHACRRVGLRSLVGVRR